MSRRSEPFWWSLFAAGGAVTAFFLPVTIFLTGVALPAGWIAPSSLYLLLHHPLARLYLFLVISLALFHAAHRIRWTLADLGLRSFRGGLGNLLYGLALVGTAAALWLAITL